MTYSIAACQRLVKPLVTMQRCATSASTYIAMTPRNIAGGVGNVHHTTAIADSARAIGQQPNVLLISTAGKLMHVLLHF
jgi:hypothetical protein